MALQGRLTKEKVRSGFNIPIDAPLYAKPPYQYRDVEGIAFTYETDEEAVADILPEGLEVPSPATATVTFVRYPFSTLGVYNEAILNVGCIWEGTRRGIIAHIVCDSLIPIAAGREIWGFPKKLAHISFDKEEDIILGAVERPKGNRIVSGVMRPEALLEGTPQPVSAQRTGPGLALRVIPNIEEGGDPSLMELVEFYVQATPIEAYHGTGSVHFESTSATDPWHKFPVKKMLSAVYRRNHMVLGYGKVLKRY